MILYNNVKYESGDMVDARINGTLITWKLIEEYDEHYYILHNCSTFDWWEPHSGKYWYSYSRHFSFIEWSFTEWVELINNNTNGEAKEISAEKVKKLDKKIDKTLTEVIVEKVKNTWTEKEIAGFLCKWRVDWDEILIVYRDYLYRQTFFGTPKDFIKANEPSIKWFFLHRTDEDIDKIIENLANVMEEHLEQIDEHILDNTRDFILTNVFKMTSDFVWKISTRVTQPRLKAKFKSALWLK